MTMTRKFQLLAAAAAVAFTGFSAPAAQADDEFSWSFNIGGFSDYRFRGESQTKGDPALQGGVDIGYGMFYAGVWASNVDFFTVPGAPNPNAEVDWYGGIKPVLGPVTFDFGIIYYTYPNAHDNAPGSFELDYLEWKVGASGNLTEQLSVGATFYYSSDYFGESGNVYTIEGTAAYSLPKFWVFDPTISGRIGYNNGNNSANYTGGFANGDDQYWYWDVGLTLAIDKYSIDLRYVDTDVSGAGGYCKNYCDSTFVGSFKVALP